MAHAPFFTQTRMLVLAAIASAGIGCGDKPSGPTPPAEDAELALTLRGFVGQPALVAPTSGGGLRYSGTRLVLRLTQLNAGGNPAAIEVTGDAFAVSVVQGTVQGTAAIPLPVAFGDYVASGEVVNAAGERLYAFAEAPVVFDAAGFDASLTASLSYVGPGQDVSTVKLAPGAIQMEVYQFTNVSCIGGRTDGTETTDFPRLMFSENESIVTVNPVTGIAFGQNPGTTTIGCRLGFGSQSESSVDVTILNRTPTVPVLLVLEAPGPLGPGETNIVPIGTRVPIRVRTRDATGDYAAGATVQFDLAIGMGGTLEPRTVVTGNDGTAEAILTVGPLLHMVRVTVPGVVLQNTFGVQVSRYGN